jgi:phospholipase A-2-activating protein
MTEYALSAELDPAHQQDVKDVLAISDDRIASCSRDGSVAIWDKSEGGRVRLTAAAGAR